MPRELLHWSVIHEVISDKTITDIFEDETNYYLALLGGMAHDCCLFHGYGSGSLVKLGQQLHGCNGEDTHTPLINILQYAFEAKNVEDKNAIFAFVFGMFAHAITDIVFHPLVFYLTGDYYNPDDEKRFIARLKHFEFESQLDVWTRKKGLANPVPKKLETIINKIGDKFDLIIEVSAKSFYDSEKNDFIESEKWLAGEIKKSWLQFSTIQKKLVSKNWHIFFKSIKPLLPNKFKYYNGLFSNPEIQVPSLFDSNITYKNPVSGIEKSSLIKYLYKDTIVKVKSFYIELLEPTLKEDSIDNFKTFDLESLCTGVSRKGVKDMSYYLELN